MHDGLLGMTDFLGEQHYHFMSQGGYRITQILKLGEKYFANSGCA